MDITVALTGALSGILIVAAILTAPFALLLTGLYRRAVIRWMSKRAQPAPANPTIPEKLEPHPSGLTTKLEFVSLDKIPPLKNEAITSLYENLRTRYWQAAAIYMVGGLCFTTLLTIAFFAAGKAEMTPSRFLYTGLVYFWPAILVLNLVAPLEQRRSHLIYAAYFFAWLVMTGIEVLINPGFTWGQGLQLWAVFNLIPTLTLIMFLYQKIRAVGPMVFTFLVFGLSGVHLCYQEAMIILQSLSNGEGLTGILLARLHDLGLGPNSIVALMLIANILFTAALGWFALQLLKWLYLHKRQSGQSLILDPIWLMFGIFASLFLVFENPTWILAGPSAFLCYKIVTWTGFAILNRKRRKIKGRELLLLRVFSLGKRSEQLYNLIARAWRYVGDIRFITGPDLATATVEPHNFLDYISGRLRHRFIDSTETLERRLENMDVFPGLDGRYRLHDFFCYDDTWKRVLSCLAQNSDVILMDLRKFSRTNAGCVFEIHELINEVPLRRVVFVVDQTTDEAFLRESMETAWKQLSSNSPNRGTCTEVHLFHYDEKRSGGFHQLLYALSVAATPG